VRRRSQRPDADDQAVPENRAPDADDLEVTQNGSPDADDGPTAADRYIGEWAWLHGVTQIPTGALLEGVAAMLAADDAFTTLGVPDARRVAAMVALDFVMYSQVGAAGVAVLSSTALLTSGAAHPQPQFHAVPLLDLDGQPLGLRRTPNAAMQARTA
jgi:hypothetical protein